MELLPLVTTNGWVVARPTTSVCPGLVNHRVVCDPYTAKAWPELLSNATPIFGAVVVGVELRAEARTEASQELPFQTLSQGSLPLVVTPITMRLLLGSDPSVVHLA